MDNIDEKKTCADCLGDASQGWVDHFVTKGNSDPVLVKTQCRACDLRDHMIDYRKTKRLCNRVTLPAALFVGDERILKESWMQASDRAAQRQDIRVRLAKDATYADDYREINAATEEVSTKLKAMELVVWCGWLQAYYRASESRGHKAKIGNVEILVWGSAGRVLLTMNGKDGESVTAIFDETSKEPRGGLQGIDATKEQALAILQHVTDNSDAYRLAIKPDGKVGMF